MSLDYSVFTLHTLLFSLHIVIYTFHEVLPTLYFLVSTLHFSLFTLELSSCSVHDTAAYSTLRTRAGLHALNLLLLPIMQSQHIKRSLRRRNTMKAQPQQWQQRREEQGPESQRGASVVREGEGEEASAVQKLRLHKLPLAWARDSMRSCSKGCPCSCCHGCCCSRARLRC